MSRGCRVVVCGKGGKKLRALVSGVLLLFFLPQLLHPSPSLLLSLLPCGQRP